MVNKNALETNLINIAIIILFIILIVAIIRTFSYSLKQPRIDFEKAPAQNSEEKKVQKSDEEYKKIIEKSKMEYEQFMEQNKNP